MFAIYIIGICLFLYFSFPQIKDKFVSPNSLCFSEGLYKIPCELDEKEKAKQILQDLYNAGLVLIEHLQITLPDSYITKNLTKRYNANSLRERSIFETEDTSYTINKGEILSMCIRGGDGEFYDMNLLMYVFLHELAHVAENDEQHTDAFWETYIILMKEAKKIGIYEPVDYSKQPTTYCDKIPLTFNLYHENQ